MIKHIVFFKLSDEGKKQQDLIVEKLNSLKDDIDCVKALEVGINFAQEDRAFDLSLSVILNSKEDLDIYAKDEKHLVVVNFLKSLKTETKVVDFEMEKKSSESEFGNATITKKANQYFNGQVTSRTVIDENGTQKTLGIMMKGDYTFNTIEAEHMEILAGLVEIEIKGITTNKGIIKGGEYFEVPANSSFEIKVLEVTDYCCTYIK